MGVLVVGTVSYERGSPVHGIKLADVRKCHTRALEGVAKSQFPLRAVVFKSRFRVPTRFPYTWNPSCTLAWCTRKRVTAGWPLSRKSSTNKAVQARFVLLVGRE